MFDANKYFGPNDNYDLLNSHFFPALLKKFIKQKTKKNLLKFGVMALPKEN